jgi:hypothetical protein
MFDQVIVEYERYIVSRQLVKRDQVGYYGRWVEMFLSFASRQKIKSFDVCLLRFLRELEADRLDWQVGQAKSAVHIYYYQFRESGSVLRFAFNVENRFYSSHLLYSMSSGLGMAGCSCIVYDD